MSEPRVFTAHALQRAIERYGEAPTIDEQFGIVRRIRKGGGVPLKRRGKDKYPAFLISWERMGALLAAVLSPDLRRVVTVLPPSSAEVQRAWQKWFG